MLITGSRKLPGHTENNPKLNFSVIFWRSGKTYEGLSSSKPENKDEEEFDELLIEDGDVEGIEKEIEAEEFEEVLVEEESEKLEEKETPTLPKAILKEYKPLPPFPSRLKTGENISFILQKSLPPKCRDPGIFTVPCKLGNLSFPKAMLDLGASVNVLPFSIFEKLNLGSLQKTGTIIQLADHSTVYPKGALEDVIVQVGELIFPADFYILDMRNLDTSDVNSIILGRPFMKTAKTNIDVFNGMISMEFDDPLLEGYCEFSNVYVQENFLDRNSSANISKELAKHKLRDVEEVELKSSTEEESDKNMKRKKLLEKEKVEVVISDTNLKRRKIEEKEERSYGKKKKIRKRKKFENLQSLPEDNLNSFHFAEHVPDPPILPYLKGSGLTRKRVELQRSLNHTS
uniref:Aspartic peptidase DDI1-type domain-containing protein n=1 Tax=Lactuca sativa TaxID=4236 RepID=A0A9R1WB05_LACSA|nr:hypothetical protein LSAT_V11C200050850 [Lactuca sativa]